MILASELEGPQKIKCTASRFIVTATMSKPGPNKQFHFFPLQDQKDTKESYKAKHSINTGFHPFHQHT